MKPITPRGTRTREISRPFGRRHDSATVPTGSGSAAISRSPCDMSSPRDPLSPPPPPPHERSNVHRRPLQDHEVVAVDHFVEAPVPQPLLDLGRLRPPDLPELRGVEVDDTSGELRAPRPGEDRDDLPGGELAFHLDDARRQQALAMVRERGPGARVHDEGPLRRAGG